MGSGGTLGAPNGTAGGAVTTPGGGVAGVGTGTAGAAPSACVDQVVQPGEASLRRLTAFEFNNTVRDLLGDTTLPAGAFPAEDFGNGFGNDAKSQTVSRDLALAYADAAEAMAKRATDSPAQLAILAPCASTVTAANEVACARTFVENVVPRAYRRALVAAEADELVTLFSAVRPNSPDFKTAVASVLEAVLQWSDTEAKHLPLAQLPEHHHFYQHDGGFRPAECAQINTWYSQQHAYMLDLMSKIDMGGHSLLDESVVFIGSELSTPASHAKIDMPLLLAAMEKLAET